jgi:phenylacetate-coenzyme A ligase PaaK-like adenylate-forming protein
VKFMPTDIEIKAVEVKDLIQGRQYAMAYEEKQNCLLPLLERQVACCRDSIPAYRKYLSEVGLHSSRYSSYADVPFLPVSVFKEFDLCTVPQNQVVRVLKSSATTTGTPSKIYLDKPTAFRQTQALAASVMELIGAQKRPYLVLDCEEINSSGSALTARGAALRGFMPFASSVTYALRQDGANLELQFEVLDKFFKQQEGKPILVSGFTYMVWIDVIQRLRQEGIRFHHPEMKLFHSGGWKRLTELSVEKEIFARGAAEAFGCDQSDVRDFYGMVEQVGVVFVDCEAGNKHTPNFAEVAIRDFLTLKQVRAGESGLIEVFSALPTSYPGQAVLTEDIGLLLGVDNCPCGRPGLHFRFQGRVAKAEIRGCGDTFAVSQQVQSHQVQSEKPVSRDAIPVASTMEFVAGEQVSATSDASFVFSELRTKLLADFEAYARTPIGVFAALLDAASRNMVTAEYASVEGISFLASWLRKSNLEKVLRLNLGSELAAMDKPVSVDGISLRAIPRGVICHWVAGNIPTLAFFSWALATLGKNASIIRVPAESSDVVRKLFRAVELASVEFEGRKYDGSLLLERTSLVHFPSANLSLNESMSLCADSRVIWGGPEAVRTVTSYPRMEHCEDVVFGPKFSLGVVDRAVMEDGVARAEAFTSFARQTVMFEQAACSSPQIIFVEAPDMDLEHLADIVEDQMKKVCSRFPKRTIEQFTSCEILRARASYGLRPETSMRASSDLGYTILLERGAALREALQSRTLYVMVVNDLQEVLPLLSQKIQTIGVAIADAKKRLAFGEACALRGAARCVRPELMNIYETPWDGLLPVNRMVRWCRL